MKIEKTHLKYDHLITAIIVVFILILFSAIQLTAQEQNKKQIIEDRHHAKKEGGQTKIINTQTATIPNAPQATGDTVTVKDDAGNVLMTVTDEGSAGSIKLNNAGAVTPSANKLYNNGGSLFWDGNAVSTGSGVTNINDLSDARTTTQSIFLGANAGSASTAFANTAIGISALNVVNNAGHQNTAIGQSALKQNTSGIQNTAIGQDALTKNSTGHNNTAIGQDALTKNITGHSNTAGGEDALYNNVSGIGNVALGIDALYNNVSGSGNVALGKNAGRNETGSNKLYINNDSSSSPLIWGDFATDDVKINGNFHVTGNITSDGIGTTAIDDLTDAQYDNSSLFLGEGAGTNTFANTLNVAVGKNALNLNEDGFSNTAIGVRSLEKNVSGTGNTAIGYEALKNSTSSKNTAIGIQTLFSNTAGFENTAIGYLALGNNLIGSRNVALGYLAGTNETGSNKLYIENSSSSTPLIWGDFANDSVKINGEFHVTNNNVVDGKLGIGESTPGFKLHVVDNSGGTEVAMFHNTSKVANSDGMIIRAGIDENPADGTDYLIFQDGDAGTLGVIDGDGTGGVNYGSSSDRRLKTKIRNYTDALQTLSKIQVRLYERKNAPGIDETGFIAQEIQKVYPQVVSGSPDSDVETNPMMVDYGKITPLLVKAIQEQEASIKKLVSRSKILDARVKQLEKENEKIRIENVEVRIQNEELKKQFVKNASLENDVEQLKTILNELVQQQPTLKVSSK